MRSSMVRKPSLDVGSGIGSLAPSPQSTLQFLNVRVLMLEVAADWLSACSPKVTRLPAVVKAISTGRKLQPSPLGDHSTRMT